MASNTYFEANKDLWNTRVETHVKSDFYRMDDFMNGWNSLDKFTLDAVGDVNDKRILHLQCHFGQDTMSFSRMGAKATGLDFSEKAIAKAKEISSQLSLDTNFVLSSVYDMDKTISGEFDIVFTSYGCIIWLDNLDLWAKLISEKLSPNGKLIIVDFHPFLMMYDFDSKKIRYDYFNQGVIEETTSETYTDGDHHIPKKEYCWSHSFSELIMSCLKSGFSLESIEEYDYAPYPVFDHVNSKHERHFQFIEKPVFPHCYSTVFQKK